MRLILDDGLLSIWSRLDARFITIAQQGPAADTNPPRAADVAMLAARLVGSAPEIQHRDLMAGWWA